MPVTGAADAVTDELVYQAVATLEPTPAKRGMPGVPLKDIGARVKKSEKTVRRSLDRLQDAERIVVTGTCDRTTKLYGISGEENHRDNLVRRLDDQA